MRIAPLRFSREALLSLERRAWPGNVRELGSVVARAAIRASADGCAEIAQHHCVEDEASEAGSSPIDAAAQRNPRGFFDATREFQRCMLRLAIEAEGGNMTRAARRLGLSRSYL